ncbi:MAG: cation-translocating P-type ATPase [Halobacteriota archaeon]
MCETGGIKLATNPEDWHALSLEEAFNLVHSSQQGLTQAEASKRLLTVGTNELPPRKKPNKFLVFLRQFKSPLIYILIVAAVITLFFGSIVDALVIALILVVNAIIGFVQENKAENVLETLKELAAPKSTVVRAGFSEVIDARQIVPGDVILLQAGDRVPADARLFSLKTLKVDESMLTGESETVVKQTHAHTSNMVYSGTVVTEGRGGAVVVATGRATEFGRIAEFVQSAEREETPLQKDLGVLGKWIGILVLVIVGILFIVGVLRSFSLFEMFLIAVSQAVSAIPEGLPAVITVVMTVGVRKMAGENAIIRRLSAVETLGSTDVILTDKTGTLTLNKMRVEKLWVPDRGLVPFSAGTSSSAFKGEGGTSATTDESVRDLLAAMTYANDAQLSDGNAFGDPTELALLAAAAEVDIEKRALEDAHPRVDEIPFDPEKLYMAAASSDRIYVKGAPEVVIARCETLVANGAKTTIDENVLQEILKANRSMAANGLRVLAAATRDISFEHANGNSTALIDDESLVGLTFLGLVGMKDPPRPEVKDALDVSRKAGIRTVMVTGDNPHTAKAIGVQVGITGNIDPILTSDELNALSDAELAKSLDDVSVFARIRPLEKRRLVEAFKKQGHIVAVTGDGVNDTPALISADIGVAMGKGGTDVAKESADMILTDDNYATIVKAVREGRRIFANIRKVILYLLSTNIAELIFIFLAILIGLPLPLYPVQILWINLVTDGVCVIPLGLELAERDVMEQQPRETKEGIISKLMTKRISFMAAIISLGTLLLYVNVLSTNHEQAVTMAFLTIAIFQLVNAFNCKSEHSVLHRSALSNRWLIISVLVALALQLAVVYVPVLQSAFRTVPVGPSELAFVFGVCLSIFVLEEVRKRLMPVKTAPY